MNHAEFASHPDKIDFFFFHVLFSIVITSNLFGNTFTDVSRSAGVEQREETVEPGLVAGSPEFVLDDWLGPGTAFADYDNDGWLDLFVVGDGGLPNALYRNNRDGTFIDYAAIAGVSHTGKGRGCVFFDYDNDGWQDLYVTCAGPNVLYHNNGDGTFTDVTAHAGVGDDKHGTSIAVADYDHDGWLDLYVVNWGKNPSLLIFNPPPKDNVLYRNRGDGTFEDVSQTAGVADDGIGWGGIFFDYDGDTWADLLVANDHGGDKLYRNRRDGTFEDVTASANIEITVNGKPTDGMGVCAGDYDNDGDLDLFLTNFDEDVLWQNNGDGTFTNTAVEAGVANEGVGWYASFVDYDNDGFRDLYVVNGNIDNSQKTNVNRLYRNLGNGQFMDVADVLNVGVDTVGRGAAAGDFDNDGAVDFYVVNNTTNVLCQNGVDTGNHWVKIQLEGTQSNRNGVGARVTVTAGGHTQMQELMCGSGFLGSDSLELEFGLGSIAAIDSVTLIWPSGVIDKHNNLSANQTFRFVEGGNPIVAVEPKGKIFTTFGGVKNAELLQNYPNPFNPETWIPYQLLAPGDVEVSIYAQDGRLIRRFDLGYQASNSQKTLRWDGRNEAGAPVASGVYFYQLRAGETRMARKMWLLK